MYENFFGLLEGSVDKWIWINFGDVLCGLDLKGLLLSEDIGLD